MLNLLLYYALRVAERVLPLLPLRAVYALAAGAGTLAYYLVGPARRGIRSNLSVAFPDHSGVWYGRTARSAFQHDAKNWADTLRIARMSDEDIRDSLKLHGWEHLDVALKKKRGVILLTVHLGNFDLVGQVIAGHGLSLTVPVERIQPAQLFDFLLARRASKGIHLVPVELAPRAMIAALRRGEIVGIAADRVVTGKTIKVQFFGRPTPFPRGIASLARHTGAPVLVGIGLRRPGGRFEGFVSGPVRLGSEAPVLQDEAAILQQIAAAAEECIREAPDQWMAFTPIWPENLGGMVPATIDQHIEAAV